MTCPAFRDPGPTLHIAESSLFALEYAEISAFIGPEERALRGGCRGGRVVSRCREN